MLTEEQLNKPLKGGDFITKGEFYIYMLEGTDQVLCKESAAEYLALSNGTFDSYVASYDPEEYVGKDIIFNLRVAVGLRP